MNHIFNRSYFHQLGDSFFYRFLEKELEGMDSVLDLGCGENSPFRKVKNRKKMHSVGLDIFKNCIEKSKKRNIHNKYIVSNVLDVKKKVKNQKFDAVIAMDVIEHLTRKQGNELIKIMKVLSNKKVIIFTPNGYYNQDPYVDNPYQIHKSGWVYSDFKAKGFKVHGMRGLKYLRGEYATIKYKPWILWGAVSFLSDFITFRCPKLAYQLFAVYYK